MTTTGHLHPNALPTEPFPTRATEPHRLDHCPELDTPERVLVPALASVLVPALVLVLVLVRVLALVLVPVSVSVLVLVLVLTPALLPRVSTAPLCWRFRFVPLPRCPTELPWPGCE